MGRYDIPNSNARHKDVIKLFVLLHFKNVTTCLDATFPTKSAFTLAAFQCMSLINVCVAQTSLLRGVGVALSRCVLWSQLNTALRRRIRRAPAELTQRIHLPLHTFIERLCWTNAFMKAPSLTSKRFVFVYTHVCVRQFRRDSS